MTREEAIINLKLSQNRIGGIKKEEWNALQMAIESLSADAVQGFRGGKIPPKEMLDGTVLIPKHQWIEMERELAELKEKFESAEVVRCKDCKWKTMYYNDDESFYCDRTGIINMHIEDGDDEFWCKYGERKGGDDE